MTVYPLIFNVGPLMITGFGIMMMIGFLMAAWVMQRYLLEKGYSSTYAEYAIIASVIGGIVGAKFWYVFLHGPEHLFSRGGLVWYGGFVGGAVAVIFNSYRLRVPIRFTMDMGSLALALGHGIGRVGCFLIQDDYGVPTSLPWGMRFPQGYPPSTAADLQRMGVDIPADIPPTEVLAVHPTQLYEVAALMFIFWLLWRWRNHQHGIGWMFAVYLFAVGIERFLVEFIRAKDDRFLGAFTLAQGMSVMLIVLGIVLMARWWQKDDLQIPKEATILHAKAEKG
ncbi:MAG: prolipoprotein diacylglyceryl transferase [Gemmatimonadota bacterium]|nr:MAG: prolipoprotein diacylglyceryl transferase [Gemmatimonadota bacterium]